MTQAKSAAINDTLKKRIIEGLEKELEAMFKDAQQQLPLGDTQDSANQRKPTK